MPHCSNDRRSTHACGKRTGPGRHFVPTLACVCLGLLWGAAPVVAQPPTPRAGQYKRIHQDALKVILEDRIDDAVAALEAWRGDHPEDAETWYMLAVAETRRGNLERATGYLQEALRLGFPANRLFAVDALGLAPVVAAAEFDELRQDPASRIQGPMLGSLRGTGVRIAAGAPGCDQVWLEVTPESGPPESTMRRQMRPDPENGQRAVFDVEGLQPQTRYRYRIGVSLTPGEPPRWLPPASFATLAAEGQPVRFRLAFGGGAGYVPQHERMWRTIAAEEPDILLLLGDNVYSDAPQSPAMQAYCYQRRLQQPDFRRLVSRTPVFSIWDDHDFGTNDCSGGPAIDRPAWKLPVYQLFRQQWANPGYGGGLEQPGCYYDFQIGDVQFIMLDGRYYRDLKPANGAPPTMLGPVQRQWLLEKIADSRARLLFLVSPVPWVFAAKGDSRDTWNGFQEERQMIFEALSKHRREGVMLMSADRHRSDLWKIERPGDYPLYEFNSSRLTNQHVHPEMAAAEFSYNRKQSCGVVEIDTTVEDPTVAYRVVSIDGQTVHQVQLRRSQMKHP